MIAKISLAVILAALSGLPIVAAPFHHSFGEWREYNQDWLAACPDIINEDATDYYGTSCFASTGSEELNSTNLPAWKLTLILNRLTGVIDVAFTGAADAVEIDTTRPLRIAFGGDAPLLFDFTTDLQTRYNTVNQWFVADPARRDSLIGTMKTRNAATLTVPLTELDEQTRSVWLSLRGVTASLDFMASYARKVAQY
ncbi:MAG: hypothetical protein JWR51_1987 [Devosia sp.]|uniref:hypothetical protein n=1 Tax=Devosia sp. TaxID=1871048 RepID=UPI00260D4F0E|nr:hypothetical protein [Devosia sp.]MDB5528884.1 hypothetical protein [Devosia sp.]